jgi:hypothetical protein
MMMTMMMVIIGNCDRNISVFKYINICSSIQIYRTTRMGMGNAENYLNLINRDLTTKSIVDGPFFEYPTTGVMSQF